MEIYSHKQHKGIEIGQRINLVANRTGLNIIGFPHRPAEIVFQNESRMIARIPGEFFRLGRLRLVFFSSEILTLGVLRRHIEGALSDTMECCVLGRERSRKLNDRAAHLLGRALCLFVNIYALVITLDIRKFVRRTALR